MKILVTGANGYIGRHVVDALLEHGADVIACDIDTSEINPGAEKLNFNIFDEIDKNIFSKLGSPDVCLHMAWRDGFVHNSPNHMGDLSNHYKFLTNMIAGGLKQLAVMGSMHEVGYYEGCIDENTPCNPLSQYAIAKDSLRRAMKLFCEQNTCVFQWLRCYYILGDDKKNHSIFAKIFAAAEAGKVSFPFTSGKNKYDFIEVDVLADMISLTVLQKDVNGIIDCCTGRPVSLSERVESFIKDNGLNIKLEYGAFPDRPYDSPCIYGNPDKINAIVKNK